MGDPAACGNERYQKPDYIFGTEANDFIKAVTPYARKGMKAFAPADGEGRNGVHLARLGYEVTSVDVSDLAVEKAYALARANGVQINAHTGDLFNWDWGMEIYDLVIVSFMHFYPEDHARFVKRIRTCLKSSGLLVFEGYTPDQIPLNSGGPKKPEMLLTAEKLRQDFDGFDILFLQEVRRFLAEGPRHQGEAATVQLLARKPG